MNPLSQPEHDVLTLIFKGEETLCHAHEVAEQIEDRVHQLTAPSANDEHEMREKRYEKKRSPR